ncbi:MAG: phosphoglycolate phosphatase, bacterial [Candidatus Binatia bacterium]|nr:MAG: phosphoglycolate phosphatase, bacterial [Candidatus Binatia bacterium]
MAKHGRWAHTIFDLDGTLVDTAEDIAAALNYALAQNGWKTYAVQDIRAMIGEGARRLVEQALPDATPAEHDKVLADFLAHYRAHVAERSRVYPGIAKVLRELQQAGVAATVLTNKPVSLSEAILRRFGLRDYLVAVCGGDTLPQRKPDPAGVFYLCALVGSRREESILVGDSGIDRDTAARAGIAFCAALWGYRAAELCEAPLRARTPEDLLGLLLAE